MSIATKEVEVVIEKITTVRAVVKYKCYKYTFWHNMGICHKYNLLMALTKAYQQNLYGIYLVANACLQPFSLKLLLLQRNRLYESHVIS